MKFPQYTNRNIEEVLEEFKTSEDGLSEKEVKSRLKIYGFNEIKAREAGMFDILLRQFKSPFFYLLFIAGLIAFLIGEKIDSLVIFVILFINVFLGFFQEFRAERATSLLKKYIPIKTRVLREGKEKIISKRFLVPGDMVLLEAGNVIPADLRVLKVENFLVDESVLTGESVSVSKISQALSQEAKEIFEAKNILFAGTSIVSGEAEGLVIGTGKETVFGEITKLVSGIVRESIYEKNLLKFCQLILRIVVSTIIFVFLANLIIKGSENFFDFLIFSIALIVSIIPEALPLVATFSLSEGALRLAKESVVVKRLSAVEDLGDIEILCADKTGTLTENKLSLVNIYSFDKERCLLYSLLASHYMAEEIESAKNPFDLALFKGAAEKILHSLKEFNVISEIPFEPFRLRNSALLEDKKGNRILIVKGAPETILKLSSKFENLEKTEIEKEIEKDGRAGNRTLAVAFKEFNGKDYTEADEKDLTFLGYFSFKDPLKKTAKETISLAKKLGLKIKILTGDSQEVTGQIGKEIGLIEDPEKVILGETLDALPKEEFDKALEEFSVFARVSPKTKFEIVAALGKKYEVGFLGEGINDAPALKVAHVAIAVKEAADISREASDIILLKKDLKVIVEGIKNGRKIFASIQKYIKCTLASNFGNFYSVALISLAIPFLPMLPIQILLVNFLTDFPLISIASDNVDIEELKKPKFYQLNKVILLIVILGLVSSIFDLIFFGIFYKSPPALIQTLWTIESTLTEISLIFLIRTRNFFLKTKRPSFLLSFLSFLVIILSTYLPFTNFGQETFHFIMPSISPLLVVFSLVLSYFVVSEIAKLIYFRVTPSNKVLAK